MISDKKVFNLILSNITDPNLGRLLKIQYESDKWGSSISGMENFVNKGKLNDYDYSAVKIFLCRDYSLKYRHNDCLGIINSIEQILKELNENNQSHLALTGFAYHTFAISLGYMGKKQDSRYKEYYLIAEKIYDQFNAVSDKADLLIQSIDLEYYYDEAHGIPGLIKKYDNIPKKLIGEKDILFRLGVMNLMGYLRVGSKNLLEKSIIHLESYLEGSDVDHYKSFWATCALIVACRAKGIDCLKLPSQAPPGAISKAERFPLMLFLVIRALRINGQQKKALKLLFGVERHLKNLINYYEEGYYKKFIFSSYGIIIDEWLLSIYEYEKYSVKEKFHYMIHVNEIIQNRLLSEKLSTIVSNQDGLINIEKILSAFNDSQPDTGLVYITSTIRNLDNNNCFFILLADPINEDSSYHIDIIELSELNTIRNDFIDKFIQHSGSPKEEQDKLLDLYGKIFFKNGCYPQSGNTVVIPNNFSLTLPIHMARIDGKYLYEISNYNYLPNLHIMNKMNENVTKPINELTIYYTSIDNHALAEAQAIDQSLKNMKVNIIKDPELKVIKDNKKGGAVHFIAHGEDGKIFFNNSVLKGDEICEALPDSLENVSFSVCKSGKVLQKELYPFNHSSWSHKMLLKNTKKVLTHIWDLGQEASNEFAINYYNNTFFKGMIKYRPSEYGGYMIWGL